ncbi:MAG TPA: TMEM175 family protein [Acetobacteraceae bacterium]|nr:TMEM175 family protein [Acetobacteraceae bacterium]
MNKERLTAFSDGVIAIIITIMVLELQPPSRTDWPALLAMLPTFLSYVLSFTYVAIYWNNHHHMLHTVRRVNGAILWANMNLLFWLSLTPFVTAWLGRNYRAPLPTAVYGVVLLLAAIAYFILQSTIIRTEGPESALATAIGRDVKGKASLIVYLAAISLAFVHPAISDASYIGVALIWFIPDRRIERSLAARPTPRS